MNKRLLLTLLCLAFANASCSAQTRTLTFETVNDADTVSFDPAKISEAELRQLVLFSPFIVSYFNDLPARKLSAAGSTQGTVVDKALIALPLELCIAHDPAYSHCEGNNIDGPNFLRNAKTNLEKSRQGLMWLRQLNYPKELQPVVKFLDEYLELSLWTEETKFNYYSTWDENVLKAVHEGIDPMQLCPEIFQKLKTASSKDEKYRTVRFDWSNCMTKAINHQVGSYPIDSWNGFLKSYGITERHEEKGTE